ncbi:MAG: hypothetical protein J6C46_01075 [Clostridia bacterium]|nr:hypothetical protein [Clostridia bacterium]
MEDSLSIIFAVIISLLLMFLFPMIDTWEMQDNLSYVVVYSAVTDFVDTVRNSGVITEEAYEAFSSKIHATGNTYSITMEHREFNEDIKAYLNTYTNEILDAIEKGKKDELDNDKIDYSYKLDKYDYFYVTVKNTNRTQATILTDFLSSNAGENFKIGVSYGGIVWSAREGY